jgi:hypothetical protein
MFDFRHSRHSDARLFLDPVTGQPLHHGQARR